MSSFVFVMELQYSRAIQKLCWLLVFTLQCEYFVLNGTGRTRSHPEIAAFLNQQRNYWVRGEEKQV